MDTLRLVETSPDTHSLMLIAGTTKVDDLIAELGHEPNGPFWEGVAQRLIEAQDPGLADRCEFDSEGDMMCARGTDRPALEELATLLRPLTTEADRMRRLVVAAEADGFDFDD